ncbi:MAG: hypothetical protein BAJALOKI2v1_120003 [Promethearchaeota archaeon]|nr:MAG: hypothetical protein BAJALOKI2v1_120003 [Candidatus Lokiarchaeota archaeon]
MCSTYVLIKIKIKILSKITKNLSRIICSSIIKTLFSNLLKIQGRLSLTRNILL